MRRSVALATTIASLIAVAPAAAASTSSNWAGYAASGTTARFKRVSATWTVAPVSCTAGRRSYSAIWVGLGGYHTDAKALEQTGTDANCDASGTAHYEAWYELVPAAPVRLPLAVRADDTISASVTVSGARVRIVLANRTTGTKAVRTLTASAIDVTSVEWIVEAPSACFQQGCTVLPLADFGTARITSARATSASGHSGAISDPAWHATAIRLSAASGRDLGPGRFAGDEAAATATPAALSGTGDAFDVTYAASAATSPDAPPPGL